MNKYIVIYHAPAEAIAATQAMSPEDMKKGMEAWGVWAASCGDGLIDMGTPLMGGLKLSPDGSSPSDREVTGYSILQADDMAGAEALLQGHPHLGWATGCSIEVHEAMPMPDGM